MNEVLARWENYKLDAYLIYAPEGESEREYVEPVFTWDDEEECLHAEGDTDEIQGQLTRLNKLMILAGLPTHRVFLDEEYQYGFMYITSEVL